MYLAYDISTSTIGEAVFTSEGKLARLSHLKLKNRKEVEPGHRFLDKAATFREYVSQQIVDRFSDSLAHEGIEAIFIEEPLITSNNPNTAALLHKFNGVCSHILYETFGVLPTFISVHEARKLFCPELIRYKRGKEVLSFPDEIDKKEYLWRKVDKMERGIEWEYNRNQQLKKECFDMSDAYVVGRAGLKQQVAV